MVKFLRKTGWCAIMVFLYSCVNIDLNKFDGVVNWEPEYKVQIAYANYTVGELLGTTDKKDSMIIEENNRYVIRFSPKEDVAQLKVGEVMTLPKEIAKIPINIPIPLVLRMIPIPKDTTIVLEDSVSVFDEGKLTKICGEMTMKCDLPSDLPIGLTVDFTNVKLDSDQRRTLTFSQATKVEKQKVIFDMVSSPNWIKYKTTIHIKAGHPLTMEEVKTTIELKDFSFSRVEGTIKPQIIQIDNGEFNMNVDFWNSFEGSFKFADPKVNVIIRNSGLGVPVQLDMDLVAYGEKGKSVKLKMKNDKKLLFEGWTPEQNEVCDTQGYNADNSNIADLLSLPPKEKITYAGKIIVAPDSTKPVTILSSGEAKVGLDVEVPLHLSARDLVFRDTFKNISLSNADNIKEAAIIIRAKNQIPLEFGGGYLYLLNEKEEVIDSVSVEHFLEAPDVDDSGEVIVSDEEKESEIVLTERYIRHLSEAKHMVMSLKASTSKSSTDKDKEVPVVIKSDAKLNLKLILKAKLNAGNMFKNKGES